MIDHNGLIGVCRLGIGRSDRRLSRSSLDLHYRRKPLQVKYFGTVAHIERDRDKRTWITLYWRLTRPTEPVDRPPVATRAILGGPSSRRPERRAGQRLSRHTLRKRFRTACK